MYFFHLFMTPLNKNIQCLYSHMPIKLGNQAADPTDY